MKTSRELASRWQEKEYYKACKCGDNRHLVGFHVLTLNNKTIEPRGFVYRTRDSVVGGSQRFLCRRSESPAITPLQQFGEFAVPLLQGLDTAGIQVSHYRSSPPDNQ